MDTKPPKKKGRAARNKGPAFVPGPRPHVLFYAPDADGKRQRVRIYCPKYENKGHKLSRWRNRTVLTLERLLSEGYVLHRGAPPEKLPLISPKGQFYPPPVDRKTLPFPPFLPAAFLWAYERKSREVRPRTAETYKTVLTHLSTFLQGGFVALDKFTKADVANFSNYLLQQGVRGITRNNYFQTARTLWNYLIEVGLETKNPFQGFRKLPHERTKRNIAIAPEHVEILETWMVENDPSLRLVCRLCYWAFARPIEAVRLIVADIDLERRVVLFRAIVSKNRKAAAVQIPADLANLFKTYLAIPGTNCPPDFHLIGTKGAPSAKQAGENTFSQRHRNALKACGLDGLGYNLYSWKHSGAVAAFDAGMSVLQIRDRCRHSSVQQTEIYLRDLCRISEGGAPSSW